MSYKNKLDKILNQLNTFNRGSNTDCSNDLKENDIAFYNNYVIDIKKKKEEQFSKIITIKLSDDGISNISNIDLGQVGDNRMTKIIFDISQLKWNQSSINNYKALLSFFDSSKEKSENNPKVYEIDNNEFIVPSELTTGVNYKVLYALRENLRDKVEGNLEEPQEEEIFISSEMNAKTTKLNEMWDPAINLDFLSSITTNTQDKEIIALEKNVFNLSFNSFNNSLSTSDDILGNKFDRYIKLVKLDAKNIYGLNNLYVIFKYQKGREIIKLDKNNQCWVPVNVTKQAGNVNISIIATDLIDKIYFTNKVSSKVNNNFLNNVEWLIPNTSTANSNFITIDNYYLVTSDSYVLYAKEI